MAVLPQTLIERPLTCAQPVELATGIVRIVAPNAGPMTGPGTNTYLVGQSAIAVIDPGPAHASHLDAICAAAVAPIKWIVVTHTHADHSPAAKLLAARTGAQLIGAAGPADGHQDISFVPDRQLFDGDLIEGQDFCLQAIHTPGHVGNHFCFLHQASGILFTGDHIMQGATVVIIPPSGDMHAYIHSVRKLQTLAIKFMAPGHGHLMGGVAAYCDALIEHRLQREAKIVAALQRCAVPTSVQALTPSAYSDVDASLYSIAGYSLWAHLLKLERDGRAVQQPQHSQLQHPFDQVLWSLKEI